MVASNKYHHGDLRTELIRVATLMLKTEGIDSITMRGLAAELSVSRTAPYRHFKDKEELLCAIAKEGFLHFGASMSNVWEQGSNLSAIDRFSSVGTCYINFSREYPEHYQLMFGNTGLLKSSNPELKKEADTTFDFLRDMLAFCQEAGVFVVEDTQLQARFVWCALHGYCSILTANTDKKALSMLDDSNYFLKKIVDGLST
ncbi:TetR/AcrR family transcriptional regulator [Vibrio astriarenae]